MKRNVIRIALFLFLAITVELGAAPKKIILIAGSLDDHPVGTHEYENNILLLKHCLESSPDLRGVKVETHFNGWPENSTALDDADTIFITSGGSDRNERDHPLYVTNRFAQLEKQMKRGCGLVMLHWSTFHPSRAHEQVTEWLGGYFDYETGTGGPVKKWFSKIETHEWNVLPASPNHQVCRGLKPFKLTEEFYFNLRFQDNDPRLTPILVKDSLTNTKENTVAWAVERATSGRSVGFTGGHFYTNWWTPDFRKLVLNAIAWTAKIEIPTEGISSSLENLRIPDSKKLPSKPTAPPAAKKIRPANPDIVKAEKEEAWVDNRWNQTDMGQFVSSSLHVKGGAVLKGLSIKVGDQNEAAVSYDTGSASFRVAWTGDFVKFDPARYGLIKHPTIAGKVEFQVPDQKDGVGVKPRYQGFYLNGNRVVLSYEIGSTTVLESPWFESKEKISAFTRTFRIGATKESNQIDVAEIKGAQGGTKSINGIDITYLEKGGELIVATVVGDAGATLKVEQGRLLLDIVPKNKMRSCKVLVAQTTFDQLEQFAELVKKNSAPEDLSTFVKPGKRHWHPDIITKGERSLSNDSYVVDTITVPYDNPYKALMFLSGVDFFDNGDAAVCSIHGDVWVVSGIDDNLEKITWKRFATGLFQPLGLRIVNNKVHVIGRDQITILHDGNRDGEADFYENFSNQIKTSAGGHDYVTCLETDSAGNFYYVDPDGVHRVSKDGEHLETIATGWRNPNGMSVSTKGVITVAPQEGNWTPASAIFEVKPNGYYGFGGPQITPQRTAGYDAPLCWIPRMIDNSSGGQVWVTSDKWGPLSGQLLHLSYGRCSIMTVLREVVEGQGQGGVVPWKLRFLSGVTRGTFNRKDGQLYVVGSQGWQTTATREGCFQRVRFTGKKVHTPVGLNVFKNGIQLTFSEKLERETAEDPGSYGIEQWNYLYAKEYGSKEYSVESPTEVGHDPVAIKSARLLADGRKVFLEIPNLKPVMQMHIQYNLNAADGKIIRGEIFNTINKLGPAQTLDAK